MAQTVRYAAVMAVIVFIVSLSGCKSESNTIGTAAPKASTHDVRISAYPAFNSSLSAQPQLGNWVNGWVVVENQLDLDTVMPVMYRVDNETVPFARTLSDDPEESAQRFFSELREPATADNTPTEKFWRQVLDKAAHDSNRVIIIFFTDGFSEGTDAKGHQLIHQYAEQLAGLPNLAGVAIIGVKRPVCSEVEQDLAPLQSRLGEMFLLRQASDSFIEDLEAFIQKAQKP